MPFSILHRSLLAIILPLAACRPDAGVEVVVGQALDSDVSVDCSSDPFADLSGDGRWVRFWGTSYDPEESMRFPARFLGLADLEEREVFIPEGQPPLREGGAAYETQPAGFCWDDRAGVVYVAFSPDLGGRSREWWRVELTAPLLAQPAESPPPGCRSAEEREWISLRPVTHTPEISRGLQVRGQGERAVELVQPDGTVLARHALGLEPADRITIERYTWSPSGTRLAYSVARQISWWFARPDRTFVQRVPDGPRVRLDAQVYHLFWRSDDELVGCTREGLRVWRF